MYHIYKVTDLKTKQFYIEAEEVKTFKLKNKTDRRIIARFSEDEFTEQDVQKERYRLIDQVFSQPLNVNIDNPYDGQYTSEGFNPLTVKKYGKSLIKNKQKGVIAVENKQGEKFEINASDPRWTEGNKLQAIKLEEYEDYTKPEAKQIRNRFTSSVKHLESGKVYENAREAAKHTKNTFMVICRHCEGKSIEQKFKYN